MKAHIPDYPAENANLRDLAHFIREFAGHNLPGLGAAGPILNAALDHLELQQAWHDLNVSRAEAAVDGETVERVAQAIYEESNRGLRDCWRWEDSGLDDEHPGLRATIEGYARAAIRALADKDTPRETEEKG